MPAPQSLPSRLIGALFVERGLVSESQIRVALEIQRETGEQLGQILVQRFGVSRKELASVVAEQWAKLGGSAGPEDSASWRRLGEIFVERGFVTQDELDQALTRQRQTGERLGEALVAQGVISKFELAGALAEQMAALGDPAAEQEAPAETATVHQLPTRADVETEPETEPEADNVVELSPATAAEPGDEAELPAGHDDAVGVDGGDRVPAPADALLSDLREALPTTTPPAGEPVPVAACLAFAPTRDGYRLVALDALPEPGETIDVPEVGVRLVLRVGRSPLPGDDRAFAFVEEPVTAPVALAVV